MPERLNHQATLDLVKIDPGVSPTRIAALQAREKACGQRFPATPHPLWFTRSDKAA